MRSLLAAAVFCLPALTLSSSADEPQPRGSEVVSDPALAGIWKLTASTNQGKKSSAEEVEGTRVIVRENMISVVDPDANERYRSAYEYNDKTKPMSIVMASEKPAAGGLAMGIYKIKGKKWTLCYALPGNPAPTKFKSTEKDGTMLMVMERLDDVTDLNEGN